MACHLEYLSLLEKAEAAGIIYVTPEKFRDIAEAAGWQDEAINIFLRPPLFLKTVLIKGKAYQLLDVIGG